VLRVTAFVALAALAVLACSRGGSGDPEDLKRLEGYWQNETGLYYFDMSDQGPVSFVLPNAAATVTPLKVATLNGQTLVLSDGSTEYSLHFDRLPTKTGSDRCLEIDSTRLCEAKR
jgi:hypothetical protein